MADICLSRRIAAALYWGPTPVASAAMRCEQLLATAATDRPGAACIRTFLGGLAAQECRFAQARVLVRSAWETFDDLGLRSAAMTYCAPVLAEVELLAGDAASSERILRELCDELVSTKDFSRLSSRASDLADALAAQGLFDEADEWTRTAERHAAADDINARMMWPPVRARVQAHRGEVESAEQLARTGVTLADTTDDLNRRARAHRELGEVLLLGGREDDAASCLRRATELFEEKGNAAGAQHVRTVRSATTAPV